MVKLFLDIETLPGDESLRRELANRVKSDRLERTYRETALRGHLGRILCIGYIKDSPYGLNEGIFTGEEPEILTQFWNLARDVDLFVGFNIFDFDLKFIIQRSVVHGVKPTKELSFARYRSDPIYDVMWEWAKRDRGDRVSLDEIAKALGLESSKERLEGDGSKVYDYYKEGRLQEIYEYCQADVRVTRQIYIKMNFIEE